MPPESNPKPANAGSDRKERTGVRAFDFLEEQARKRRVAFYVSPDGALIEFPPRPVSIADQRIRRGL